MGEKYPDNEPTSQKELRELKELAASYAMSEGKYYANHIKVLDEHQGLPVVTGEDIHYTAITPFERIQALVPSALAVLELGDELRVSFFPPHYRQNSKKELKYEPGSAMFEVTKPEEDARDFEVIVIKDADDALTVDRFGEYKRAGPPLESVTLEDAAAMLAHSLKGITLAKEMGLADITKKEAQALLDILKAVGH
jgi:hypothetical protein